MDLLGGAKWATEGLCSAGVEAVRPEIFQGRGEWGVVGEGGVGNKHKEGAYDCRYRAGLNDRGPMSGTTSVHGEGWWRHRWIWLDFGLPARNGIINKGLAWNCA